jgi:hypothetical protein
MAADKPLGQERQVFPLKCLRQLEEIARDGPQAPIRTAAARPCITSSDVEAIVAVVRSLSEFRSQRVFIGDFADHIDLPNHHSGFERHDGEKAQAFNR